MQRVYKCLPYPEFTNGNFKLVPIRDEDKYSIMQWRNEQIDILRQQDTLTKEKQDAYFKNVVDQLFVQEKPSQLLFSFLENGVLVGYGGLVHINWEHRNAEISFLTATARNQSQFESDWKNYLTILKQLTSLHLNFIKIYTYAYDIRPHLYPVLIESNFVEEARLKSHAVINQKNYDVLIHSCFLNSLTFRMARKEDVLLYFNWTNDEDVRRNSFNENAVEYESHCQWFYSKLASPGCRMYLFSDLEGKPVGQVRVEAQKSETVIGISVDKFFRGKSFSAKMLIQATGHYLSELPESEIVAYIKYENKPSYRSFVTAGFSEKDEVLVNGIKSYRLIKRKKI